MLTDGKVEQAVLDASPTDIPMATIASEAGNGRKIRLGTYLDVGILPSHRERQPREYRTREDPLESFWPEIEELLKGDSRLRPFALLNWLKQKYNSPAETKASCWSPIRFDGRWSGEFSGGNCSTGCNRKSNFTTGSSSGRRDRFRLRRL